MIYKLLFYMIVPAHFAIIIGNLLSMIVLPFTSTPWYVTVPVESFLFNLILNPIFKTCPITNLECKIRSKIGKPPIKSFLGHYVFSPIRKLKRKMK